MKKEYNFTKSKKNPYASKLKKQITIKLDPVVIDYFKDLAEETSISYQNLINMYLKDCTEKNIKPTIKWNEVA